MFGFWKGGSCVTNAFVTDEQYWQASCFAPLLVGNVVTLLPWYVLVLQYVCRKASVQYRDFSNVV